MTSNSVDLPHPLGPTSATNSPGATSNSTPASTSSAPNDLRRPSMAGFCSATAAPGHDQPLDQEGQPVERHRDQRGDQHGGQHEVGAEGVLLQVHEDAQP